MKMYKKMQVAPKSKFQPGSFRTIDPGRIGHTKLVIGRLKSGPHKGKTRTQTVMWQK